MVSSEFGCHHNLVFKKKKTLFYFFPTHFRPGSTMLKVFILREAVLWIQIRMDLELLPGSRIWNYCSGSSKI